MQPLPKPKRIRSQATLRLVRREAEASCQYVDPASGLICEQTAEGEPHHIRTRGAGGEDIPENLIQLCGVHHRAFHDGKINRNELIEIVAEREGKLPEEIAAIIQLEYEPFHVMLTPPQPSVPELIQAYIQLEEHEQENRFAKGQLLDAMLDAGATQKYLSSQLGVSPSQVRELVHVYKTFADPASRNPALSWYHHRVASRSSDPPKYLAEANDEGLSIRVMKERILKEEGQSHLVQAEADVDQKKAEKLLQQIRDFLSAGGSAAQWLIEEIRVITGGGHEV
jgi:hypothetical protein